MRGMILAAGLGTRMRPLTDHTPKPLLEVGGKPLIVWHLEALRAASITEVVINTAWLGDKLESALGDGRSFGVNILWSHEPAGRPLETAGGIVQALHLIGHEPFLLVNGDIWLRYRMTALRTALAPGKQAHLVLVDNPAHNPTGDFGLQDITTHSPQVGRRAVLESKTADSAFTYAGLAVYCPSLFQGLSQGVRPLAPVLHEAISAGRASGEYFAGPWVDVGTPQRLQELDAAIRAEHI
ncbi:MAG: N-acetylmuramate alpha-1-phosphate uridylyltransferase MurU [Paraperlucidibaca sp.]